MQYQEILSHIDFLCKTDSTSYSLTDKTRNANRWYYKAAVRQMKANRNWRFDDTNLTSLPTAVATMVAGQADYTWPTNFLRLHGLYILDQSGNRVRLDPINQEHHQSSLDERYETSGRPEYYEPFEWGFKLRPAPSATQVTLSSGIIIDYDREIDIFISDDTTQQPSIPEPFQHVIALGASYDYFLSQGEFNRANALRAEVEALLNELTEFAASKDREKRLGIKPFYKLFH